MVSLNQSEGAEQSSLAIYRQIVGPPKKCRVMGWGGMKTNDVYRSLDEGSHKDIHVIPRRELELKVQKMEEELSELRNVKEQMKKMEEKMNLILSQSRFLQEFNKDNIGEDEDEEQIASDDSYT